MSRRPALPVGLCLLAAALAAHAQYRIDRYVIAGGGGLSAGPSVFAIEGTVGQPLVVTSCSPGAVDCASADWSLASGYWTNVPCDTAADVVFCSAFEN
jgi:hypothetical protein